MGVDQHPPENRTSSLPIGSRRRPAGRPWAARAWTPSRPQTDVHTSRCERGPGSNATTGSGPKSLGQRHEGGVRRRHRATGTGESVGLPEYVGTDLGDLRPTTPTWNQRARYTNYPSTDGTRPLLRNPAADHTEQTIDMTQVMAWPGYVQAVTYIGSTMRAHLNAMATASPLNAQSARRGSGIRWTPAPTTYTSREFGVQGQNSFDAAATAGGEKRLPPRFGRRIMPFSHRSAGQI